MVITCVRAYGHKHDSVCPHMDNGDYLFSKKTYIVQFGQRVKVVTPLLMNTGGYCPIELSCLDLSWDSLVRFDSFLTESSHCVTRFFIDTKKIR